MSNIIISFYFNYYLSFIYSGLDSTTTVALCDTLKGIALKRRMTIAAVIHQPSIGAFKTFDDLLLLGKGGRVVYHGPICEAESYFNSIGFKTPEETNPADFYMNIVSGGVPREGFPDFKKEDLFDLWITSRGLAAPAALETAKDVDVLVEDTKPLPASVCSRSKEYVTRFPVTQFVWLWATTLFWLFIDWLVDLYVIFKVSDNNII